MALREKRGTTTHLQGGILFVVLSAKMVLLAMVGIKEPGCTTLESVRKKARKDMQEIISLMLKLRNLKHFIKIHFDLTKNNTVQQMNSIQFLKGSSKKEGRN